MDIQKFTELFGDVAGDVADYVAGDSKGLAILKAHEQDVMMRAHHIIMMRAHEYCSISYVYDILCPHETTIQPPETQTRNSDDDDDDDIPELVYPSQPEDN